MKKIILLVCLSLSLASVTSAAEFLGPEKKSGQGDVILPSDQSRKNLYVGGANVVLNGNVSGDLVTGGGSVTMEGSVEKDANFAGGNLFLNGSVGDDVRLAGGNISVSSAVGGDFLVAGGNINFSEKASIGGDFLAAGGNVSLGAPVRGRVRIFAESVVINSTVEGDVNINVSKSLVFGPKAHILGKVKYTSPGKAEIKEGALVGNPEYIQMKNRGNNKRLMAAIFSFGFLVKLAAWILAALVFLKFRKKHLDQVFVSVKENFWNNLGFGLAGFIVWPIGVLLLFVTLVGYYLALVGLFSYISMILLVSLTSALFMGSIVLKYFQKQNPGEDKQSSILLAVVGVLVFHILKFIPIVGWVVCAAVFLAVFGAGMRKIKETFAKAGEENKQQIKE